jgi:carbon starvation protein
MSYPGTPRWIRAASWTAVSLLGAASIAVLAWSRGETVSALWMVVAAGCTFAVGYRFHSAWLLARVLTLDDMRAPPAAVQADGMDYVKTPRWVVFGHHFAAIAGPGPLLGPVLAAQFGYLPGLLWMLIGATLGGAVHDCVILFCSVRRGGRSLGRMIRDEVGPTAGAASLVAITAIMVILLAVLALAVVKALANSPWGVFTVGSTLPIAVVMGLGMRAAGPHTRPLAWISALGVIALLAAVWGGGRLAGSPLGSFLVLKDTTLAWCLMGYGAVAAILPVWLILAPRDYLSTFMKIGTVGILAGAIILLAPQLRMPALTAFVHGGGPVLAGPVFPFCFITIACAAISGFHSIIASGTTPKILARERDIRLVGYGAMVTEMCVGIMALIAACTMQPGQYFSINTGGDPHTVVARVNTLGYPVSASQMDDLAAGVGERTMIGRTGGAPTFAVGMAQMFSGLTRSRTAMALWYHFAIMFEALFILTTLDAGTRVGRFLVQDFLSGLWKPLGETRSLPANILATLLFVAAWGWFLYQGVIDPLGGIYSLWPIFGVANQLLAVIALSFGTTVLIRMGRARFLWVTLLPLGWLVSVTMTAGWMKIFSDDPTLGFLSGARALSARLAAADGPAAASLRHQIANAHVDAVVTGLLLALVVIILLANVRVWWRLLAGRQALELKEDAYVMLKAETLLKAET